MANPIPFPTNAFPTVDLIPTLSNLTDFLTSPNARPYLPDDHGRADFSQDSVSFFKKNNNFLRMFFISYFV